MQRILSLICQSSYYENKNLFPHIADTATYRISSDTLTVSHSYPQSPVIFYLSNFINPDSLTLTSVGYNPMPMGILFLNHVSLSRE
jgi:hypothetical protein